MKINKAVITAAGSGQRNLPLQTLVDRDGQTKSALTILLEEVLQTGIEEIGLVICPGDKDAFQAAAGAHVKRLRFIEQAEPLGYGHAILRAHAVTGTEPFLLLVGDHLYVAQGSKPCAKQLVEIAEAESCSVSAVQATHESKLPYYGTVGGRRLPGRAGLYQVEQVIEKPTPTVAEQKLIVPGLRAGHYLCFFGMHVLTGSVMDTLQELISQTGVPRGVHLSAALAKTAERERYLASELQGRRYDIGLKYGLLNAQLAIALSGPDRDEVLTHLVELLAQK
ncbi:MAG: UTP--glucose-1-phosphate uridylyltransferase [Verrucomicrobiae bacterium]|nr:UTP--glucose-1-phosphate uridylyltransferase [Verrucomicrobiae bacterium]